MKKIISKRKLGRETSHRLALMRNQVTSLILHERIKTTVPKAKELRVYADHVITWGKQGIYHFLVNLGDLHAIREINKIVYDKEAAKKVFEVLAPRYKERPGGYTRILRCGYRVSDKAPVCYIEYIDREGEIRACKHSYLPDETRPKLSSEPPKENFE